MMAGVGVHSIRAYCESDLEAVALLFTASVHHVADQYYDANQLAAWAPQPPDLSDWAQRLASVETLVAEVGGKLAGFLSYELNGHIDLLYTSPVTCRRGVASALYRHAEMSLLARGVKELFTEASLAARPFFERHGFEVTEEQRVQRRGVIFLRYAMRKSVVEHRALSGHPTRLS